MNEQFRILVIDDDPVMRDSCLQILSRSGCEVILADCGTKGIELYTELEVDVVILDMKLPDGDGFELLRVIREKNPQAAVIIITGYPAVKQAVELMKAGCFDYIPKPFTPNILRSAVSRALEKRNDELDTVFPRHELKRLHGADAIIGESPVISELKAFIHKAGMSDCSVLITGETGTGKELVARALHYCSRRRNNNFITVDSGGLADTLIESELFGHVRGSFTGAYSDRVGRFEMANRGTLFFDEIANMSMHVQSKLLRVLQEQEFTKVGSSRSVDINVRIIAATNSIIPEAIEKSEFREDLYYRLNVITVHMPPLRERRIDIPVLAEYYLNLFREKKGQQRPEKLSPGAAEKMMNYDWPGNVRELENVMERAVALCEDVAVDPFCVLAAMPSLARTAPLPCGNLRQLEDIEKDYIEKILRRFEFNKSRTARILGIDRKTLRKKIEKYEIEDQPLSGVE